jgi:hypothetical protein
MPAAPTADTTWPPGWYSDPWTAGQYRYWTGTTWTGETNRWGPTHAGGGTDPWPQLSSPVTTGYGLPTSGPRAAATAPSSRRGPIVAGVIVLVLLVAASATAGYLIDSHSRSKSSAAGTQPLTPGTSPNSGTTPATTPNGAPATTDPDARVLGGLVVQQSDVGAQRVVALIPSGTRTSQPTLDLCNGTFASEKLRTARLQVATYDANESSTLSTEAVLYKNPAAGAQAMRELTAVRASCPHRPVKSPVGEGTSATEFKAAPDKGWPHTPTVQRQAYSTVSTAKGKSFASIAVYLRRGRALLGLYFLAPNRAQAPVAGETSIQGIVGVFEARMARLAPAVVNRGG